MAQPITPLGKKWEIQNSLWLIWLLFPFGFTAFISFFYIGVRVKKLKWLIAGFIYALLVIQAFVFTDIANKDSALYDLSIFLCLAGWIAACVHAFLARREYLILLVKKIKTDASKITSTQTASIKAEMAPKVSESLSAPIETFKTQSTPVTVTPQSEPDLAVNVNTATKEEFAAIPSIGNLLAEQIIQTRNQDGSFASFSEFVQKLDMKPHILAKAKPYLIFPDDETKASDDDPNKSEYSSGRIVDF